MLTKKALKTILHLLEQAHYVARCADDNYSQDMRDLEGIIAEVKSEGEWGPIPYGEYLDNDKETIIEIDDNRDGTTYLALKWDGKDVCCALPINWRLEKKEA